MSLVAANSLDENDFQPGPIVLDENVGFIGTYSSLPNLEAAQFLAEQRLSYPAAQESRRRALS